MRVHFCGVRGSTQAVGPEFARYGGHTSCVAVADDDGPPRLLLDAGTGLRRVPPLLDGAAFRGAILLGHLHWDHTHGLPFFAAGDHPDAAVSLYLPAQPSPDGGPADALSLLARGFSPPHFPIDPTDLRGDWRFHTLDEGSHRLAGLDVTAREIPHKGGRTFGYRVSDGRSSIAYLSDHHPTSLGDGPDGAGPHHEAALALARDVDLLIHDAQYRPEEWPTRGAFGHTTAAYAVGLGRAAGSGRVALFHHDPARTDDELDALADEWCAAVDPTVLVAAEGTTLRLGPTDPGG